MAERRREIDADLRIPIPWAPVLLLVAVAVAAEGRRMTKQTVPPCRGNSPWKFSRKKGLPGIALLTAAATAGVREKEGDTPAAAKEVGV